MNKFGIVLICLILLFAGFFYLKPTEKSSNINKKPIATSNWQKFKPNSGLFTVELPHPPQYAKDMVPIPGTDLKRRYDMYVSEEIDGTLYLISVITYPNEAEASEPLDIMKQTIDELMKTKPDNKLTKMDKSQFKTLQSFDFSFVNGEFFIEGKIFTAGKTVFVLSYVTRKGEFDAADYQRFINSFELVEKEGVS